MNKNVLLVFVVILTPIVILGVLAMAGAENFEEQKEAAEHEETETATEAAAGMTPVEELESVTSSFYMSPMALQCLTV